MRGSGGPPARQGCRDSSGSHRLVTVPYPSGSNGGRGSGCIMLLVSVPFKETLQSKVAFCISGGVKITSSTLHANKSPSARQ